MINENRNLKIAVFLDGRPGHEKQTQSILDVLKNRIKVHVNFIQIKKASFYSQGINWFRFFLMDPMKAEEDLSGYDLLIGTGTHTHLPMLLYKEKMNIPVVSCMTPSSVLFNHFDLLFVPQHDNVATGRNIVNTVGPPSSLKDCGQHDHKRVLVLIGGTDPKSHIWNSIKIVKQIESVIAFEPHREFIISSSPRTPIETTEKISILSNKLENVHFYDFRDTPSGWVEKEYNRCKYTWVTGDSISMIYEALSSGCRVGIIPVEWRKKNSKFIRSERYLLDMGFVLSLNTYLDGQTRWKHESFPNQAEICAEEIIRRWA